MISSISFINCEAVSEQVDCPSTGLIERGLSSCDFDLEYTLGGEPRACEVARLKEISVRGIAQRLRYPKPFLCALRGLYIRRSA